MVIAEISVPSCMKAIEVDLTEVDYYVLEDSKVTLYWLSLKPY